MLQHTVHDSILYQFIMHPPIGYGH